MYSEDGKVTRKGNTVTKFSGISNLAVITKVSEKYRLMDRIMAFSAVQDVVLSTIQVNQIRRRVDDVFFFEHAPTGNVARADTDCVIVSYPKECRNEHHLIFNTELADDPDAAVDNFFTSVKILGSRNHEYGELVNVTSVVFADLKKFADNGTRLDLMDDEVRDSLIALIDREDVDEDEFFD